MMKPCCSLLLLALLCGCPRSASRSDATPALAAPPDVKVWGALRAMMHEGHIQSQVELSTLLPGPHLYGIGALAGMRGEVTILDGIAWIARGEVAAGKAHPGVTNEGATLLVASKVPAWTSTTLVDDIAFEQLDARIEALAKTAGIDVSRPFPFLIEGKLLKVKWHVLNGPPPPGSMAHGHAQNAIVEERDALDATLIGFFSTQHQGVFTHLGQNTHAHVLHTASGIAGHADDVSIRAGSVLKLPAPHGLRQ